MFTELTPEIIVFLVYIEKSEIEQFKRQHQRPPKDIMDINVGDQFVYQGTTSGGNKMEKNAIFMGKNTEGKYVLHFPG